MSQLALVAHGQDTTGKGALIHKVVEESIHRFQAVGSKAVLLWRGERQRHLAPRQLDAVAIGVEVGQGHGQLALHVELSEEGTDRSALARSRRTVRGDEDRNFRNLGEEVGTAIGQNDHRRSGFPEALDQAGLGGRQVVRGSHPDEGRDQHMGVVGSRLEDLLHRFGRDLPAQGESPGFDAAAPELCLGQALDSPVSEAGGDDDMKDPEGLFGLEWQDVAFVAHYCDRGPGHVQRAFEILWPSDALSQRFPVDQPILVQAQPGLGLQDAAHRAVETLFAQLSLFDSSYQGLNCDPYVGGQENDISPGLDGPHGGLAGPGRTNAGHFQGVGDDQPIEAQLVTKKIVRYSWGERRRCSRRIDGRQSHMGRHDRVDTGLDRGSEGHQFDGLQPLAVDSDHGALVVAVGRGIAMTREVFGRGQHAALSRALDIGSDHARHELGVLTIGTNVDDRIGGIVVDVGHGR